MMAVVDWPGVSGTMTTRPPHDSHVVAPTTVSGA